MTAFSPLAAPIPDQPDPHQPDSVQPDPVQRDPGAASVEPGPRATRLARLRHIGRTLPPLPPAEDLRRVIAELRPAWDETTPQETDASPDADPATDPDATRSPVAVDPREVASEVLAAWSAIPVAEIPVSRLDAALVVTGRRADPAHGAFDVLRAKMGQAMAERGWTRVGVTSPTKGCGKSFTTLNLAVNLARVPGARTVLVDLDLRQPSLARALRLAPADPIAPWLRGKAPPALRRLSVPGARIAAQPSEGLVMALNGRAEPDAAELILEPSTRQAIVGLGESLAATTMIFDLPPALALDDVIAAETFLDCVLIVAGGGRTTAQHLQETARRLGPNLPVLGIVLNRGEGPERYDYSA